MTTILDQSSFHLYDKLFLDLHRGHDLVYQHSYWNKSFLLLLFLKSKTLLQYEDRPKSLQEHVYKKTLSSTFNWASVEEI